MFNSIFRLPYIEAVRQIWLQGTFAVLDRVRVIHLPKYNSGPVRRNI